MLTSEFCKQVKEIAPGAEDLRADACLRRAVAVLLHARVIGS